MLRGLKTPPVEAPGDAGAVPGPCLPLVQRPFEDVDMMPAPKLFAQIGSLAQGVIVQGEACVQADHTVVKVVRVGGARLLRPANVALVLCQPGVADGLAVTVRDLVAEQAAHSDHGQRFLNTVQAAGDGVGAGVVVDDRGHPFAHGGDGRKQRAVVYGVQIERLIQRPPQPGKDLREVARLPGHRQPAGVGAVKMHVGVDKAGHEQPSPAVDDLGAGKARRDLLLRPDGDNSRAIDGDGCPGKQPAIRCTFVIREHSDIVEENRHRDLLMRRGPARARRAWVTKRLVG